MGDSIIVNTTRDDHRIAWFTALAITIHIAESALPSPIPGVKPGLANVVTIAVLIHFGWRIAVWVNLLRVIAGSLVIGTFLTPTFILSLSGALASTCLLVLLYHLPGDGCSAIGYSVASALVHILAQFWVAYYLFIQHPGFLRLLPILMTVAMGFGLITGLIAQAMLKQLAITLSDDEAD